MKPLKFYGESLKIMIQNTESSFLFFSAAAPLIANEAS